MRAARTRSEVLKASYRDVASSEALKDILRLLDDSWALEHSTGIKERDNLGKSAVYLQRADVYDTIRLYIRQMTDVQH
jgi:hypothetical protein